MQSKASKNYYNFVGGLNTEASDLTFPDNSSQDEANFELLVGGSRRRRRGLRYEEDAATLGLTTLSSALRNSAAFVEYSWRTVAGDGNINFIVQQAGDRLFIFQDDRVTYNPSGPLYTLVLSSATGVAAPGGNSVTLRDNPLDFSYGRGDLIVVGEYVNPFFISYDPDAETFSFELLDIRERDFIGVDEDRDVWEQPAVLTPGHQFNLFNQGWTNDILGDYYASQTAWPALNQAPRFGLQRSTASGINDDDGIKQFSPNKLVAEFLKDVEAPRGHFKINVFDNGDIKGSGTATGFDGGAISTWAFVGAGPYISPTQTITVTTGAAHGLLVGRTVRIAGQNSIFNISPGGVGTSTWDFNGTYEVLTTPLATTFTIQVTDWVGVDFDSWADQYDEYGTWQEYLNREGAEVVVTDKRFRAVAFYAGRAWYAGCPSSRIASRLYFTQIVERERQYGECYQEADPTDPNFPDLIETDGGVINIPEMGQVTRMVPFESSLVVFTETGVWEISGGFRQYFSALEYEVRKLSDARVYAPRGITMSENMLFFASADGLHIIRMDYQAGILIEENISEERVQNLWASIPGSNWKYVKAAYDPVRKRVWWLYNRTFGTANFYRDALIFDMRILAYFRYNFPDPGAVESDNNYIVGISNPRIFCCSGEMVFKFTTIHDRVAGGRLYYSEFHHQGNPVDANSYLDWGVDSPAYMITGPELMEDGARRKQAPTIHTFMRRTETGFEDVGGDLVPKNESGCLLRARWDWADDENSGKWSTAKQIYKHRRRYQPEDVNDTFENGHPVIVTREKIFGSGRALQLEFRSEAGKPAELLGWSTDFSGNPEV